MPWCPKCKDEYEDHVVRCADCGEFLVSELPVIEKKQETQQYNIEDYMFLTRVDNPIEAEIVIAKLEADKFSVIKQQAGFNVKSTFASFSSQGCDIFILKSQFLEAKQYIEEANQDDYFDVTESYCEEDSGDSEAVEDSFEDEKQEEDEDKFNAASFVIGMILVVMIALIIAGMYDII